MWYASRPRSRSSASAGRIDRQQQLGHVPRLRKRVQPHVDALQVQQHARQHLRLGRRRQQRRIERRFVADMTLQQPAAVVLGQPRAAMKRIEDERREAHEEVPRKVHAFDLNARSARHFHVDERERNRDARAALEHFVEKAVARIVVAIAVAREALPRRRGTRSAHRPPSPTCARPAGSRSPTAARARRRPWRRAVSRYGAGSSDGHSSCAIISAGVARSRSGLRSQLREFADEDVFHRAAHYRAVIAAVLKTLRRRSIVQERRVTCAHACNFHYVLKQLNLSKLAIYNKTY